ncbi:MAG: hypothetical protein OEW30_17390 [Acidimicrobiia bacterium]|nr:hypothetical protein [Acidimicrobiia bacterium]
MTRPFAASVDFGISPRNSQHPTLHRGEPHWFVMLAGLLGCGVGWVASISHVIIGVALSAPTVWVLHWLGRRWLGAL